MEIHNRELAYINYYKTPTHIVGQWIAGQLKGVPVDFSVSQENTEPLLGNPNCLVRVDDTACAPDSRMFSIRLRHKKKGRIFTFTIRREQAVGDFGGQLLTKITGVLREIGIPGRFTCGIERRRAALEQRSVRE